MKKETIYIQRPTESERQGLFDRTARLLKNSTRDQLIKALSDQALSLVHRTIDTSDEELAALMAMTFVAEALENHVGNES